MPAMLSDHRLSHNGYEQARGGGDGENPKKYIFSVTRKVVAAGYNPRSLRDTPRFSDAIFCPAQFAAGGFVWLCFLLHVGSGAGDESAGDCAIAGFSAGCGDTR